MDIKLEEFGLSEKDKDTQHYKHVKKVISIFNKYGDFDYDKLRKCYNEK